MAKACLVIFMVIMLAITGFVSGCRSTPAAQPPAPGVSSAPADASQFTAGQSVFAARCSRCHGDKGQGLGAPALVGANARLGKYSTAQGLLDFVSSAMPADKPGSLTRDQYLQVLDFLLVQNSVVPAQTALDPNKLSGIQLK